MRTCVIFNPVAKGDKARRFRANLDRIGAKATLFQTTRAGDARRLSTEAVNAGFERIIAAGGDGTLNEVLNGIGDAPSGFDRVCLGILPLGTVNVFAREIGMPTNLEKAWAGLLQGLESRIDLPQVRYGDGGSQSTRYFAQLAGAGLDAKAIELVDWPLKKRIGPGAYVVAGLKALCGQSAIIQAKSGAQSESGELVLIGNGRLYGGDYEIFPGARLRDGRLEVCVFPDVSWFSAARCGGSLLAKGLLPAGVPRRFQAEKILLTSSKPVPLQVDGELIGHLPAELSVLPNALRVITPAKIE